MSVDVEKWRAKLTSQRRREMLAEIKDLNKAKISSVERWYRIGYVRGSYGDKNLGALLTPPAKAVYDQGYNDGVGDSTL